jgi:hypothetical protein
MLLVFVTQVYHDARSTERKYIYIYIYTEIFAATDCFHSEGFFKNWCTNSRHPVAVVTKFCTVALNNFGSLVRNKSNVTLLPP